MLQRKKQKVTEKIAWYFIKKSPRWEKYSKSLSSTIHDFVLPIYPSFCPLTVFPFIPAILCPFTHPSIWTSNHLPANSPIHCQSFHPFFSDSCLIFCYSKVSSFLFTRIVLHWVTPSVWYTVHHFTCQSPKTLLCKQDIPENHRAVEHFHSHYNATILLSAQFWKNRIWVPRGCVREETHKNTPFLRESLWVHQYGHCDVMWKGSKAVTISHVEVEDMICQSYLTVFFSSPWKKKWKFFQNFCNNLYLPNTKKVPHYGMKKRVWQQLLF